MPPRRPSHEHLERGLPTEVVSIIDLDRSTFFAQTRSEVEAKKSL